MKRIQFVFHAKYCANRYPPAGFQCHPTRFWDDHGMPWFSILILGLNIAGFVLVPLCADPCKMRRRQVGQIPCQDHQSRGRCFRYCSAGAFDGRAHPIGRIGYVYRYSLRACQQVMPWVIWIRQRYIDITTVLGKVHQSRQDGCAPNHSNSLSRPRIREEAPAANMTMPVTRGLSRIRAPSASKSGVVITRACASGPEFRSLPLVHRPRVHVGPAQARWIFRHNGNSHLMCRTPRPRHQSRRAHRRQHLHPLHQPQTQQGPVHCLPRVRQVRRIYQ